MSVGDDKLAAYSRRNLRNVDELAAESTRREAEELLAKKLCPCGLPKDTHHAVCIVCYRALPLRTRLGLRDFSWGVKAASKLIARKFAAARKPDGAHGVTRPTTEPELEHHHD